MSTWKYSRGLTGLVQVLALGVLLHFSPVSLSIVHTRKVLNSPRI